MRVRALVSFVGAGGVTAAAGEVVEVSPADGQAWGRAGLVESVAPAPAQLAVPRREPETAVGRRGRRG